ncbi:MAG TPA: transglutaminase family protein [Pseudomonadales bacterium]
MRYRVSHDTEYLYSDTVSHCYNLACLVPRTSRRQRCISNRIVVEPTPASSSRRTDYFGNEVFQFEIQQPHQRLLIRSVSEVDTGPQYSAPQLDIGISCADARRQLDEARTSDNLLAREFVFDSPMVKISDALRDYAAPSFADERSLLGAVMDLTRRIHNEFSYCPESTTIATPLAEVLEKRRGVCQDFAHLQIGCLRAMGFAAKYVSGYIETLPPPGKEKLVGSDASHAWISVYSPAEGWVEFDPTNNCVVADQHVITAWGRDYYDVTPLRGVIFGGGDAPVLNVAVDVQRL